MKDSKQRLQQSFRMQTSATMSVMTREKNCSPNITGSFFFPKWVARIESSKEPEPVPSISGMSETVACPPSPVADDPPAPHLPPPLPPPGSNSSCQFHWCQSLYAGSCTELPYFSSYCTVRFKMFSLFFCICFLCIILILLVGCVCVCVCIYVSHSVVSKSLWPHGL